MNRLLTIPIALLAVLMLVPCTAKAQGKPTYQVGWENYKPSEFFVKGTNAVFSKGYLPKDSLNIVTSFSSIDSSDIGSTSWSSHTQFKKIAKIWSTVVKDTVKLSFPSMVPNKKPLVTPFVGIEEWVYPNEEEATKCIELLRSGMVGTYKLDLKRPPREFARIGNRVYYFYTFPIDFLPQLLKVRDIFLQSVANPDMAR